MWLLIALSWSGRLLINQPTGPWRSTMSVSNFEKVTVLPSIARPSIARPSIARPSIGLPFGGLPKGGAALRERERAFLLVGVAPHVDELLRAGAARVGEAVLERAPQRLLGRAHGRGRVLGDRLRQLLCRVAQAVGGIDDLRDHPELTRPRHRDAFRPADQ